MAFFRFLAGMRQIPFIILAVLFGCTAHFTPADELAIRGAMAEQETAWDNGDVHAFMVAYSDTICFLSNRGRTCGKAQVTANYLRNYPDKTAMGDLAFSIHEVVAAGRDNAWCTGTWRVQRTADTLSGGFSLLWVRGSSGWRIVRDHTY